MLIYSVTVLDKVGVGKDAAGALDRDAAELARVAVGAAEAANRVRVRSATACVRSAEKRSRM